MISAAESSALVVEPAWIMVFIAVTGMILGGLVYYVKAEVQRGNDKTQEVKDELVPNHGSPSLRQRVDTIKEDVDALKDSSGRAEERHLNNERRILSMGQAFLSMGTEVSEIKSLIIEHLINDKKENPNG